MTQPHFPDKIKSLPIFRGRFEAHKLTADNVDIYFASYPKATAIQPHQHDTDNYGVITQGQLILIIDGKEQRFYPGDWYHVAANQVHAARFERDISEIELWFRD